MTLNKYGECFCYYVLVVLRTLKKVFPRCNFSNISQEDAQLDVFQRKIIVFAIDLSPHRWRSH